MAPKPTTRPSFNVMTILAFKPNSYGVLALALLMRSTSGACRAYRHDSVVFEQLVSALLTVRGCRGAPDWPHKLHADKAYDFLVAPPTGASWASQHVLPEEALNAMTGSDDIAGWSSGHMLGSLPSASCVVSLSSASTFMSNFFLWLAA